MYIYLLPLTSSATTGFSKETIVPTPDGGIEHTTAKFDAVGAWLARAAAGDISLYPPQYYLLTLLSRFLPSEAQTELSTAELQTQRDELLSFLAHVPTADSAAAAGHLTSRIPWADKVISPSALPVERSDGRVVLGLEKPGPELKGSGRGGDFERVVVTRFTREGPSEVEIRSREEILAEGKVVSNATVSGRL